jgi:glycosyltransferase involved in cell wall biosynthesis
MREISLILTKSKRSKDSIKSSADDLLISIITIVFNDFNTIERTIQSVINQTYKNIEYIIIDGGSTDGTLSVIKKYSKRIDLCISEKDEGIYDAMNKALKMASGEWVNFMNSGDILFDNNVMMKFQNEFKNSRKTDFFYSDSFLKTGRRFICNKEKRILIHQSVIYKLAIHEKVGHYVVMKGFTTADYLFFMMSYNFKWEKLEFPVSIHDADGISSGLQTFLQKNAIDLLFGFNGRLKTIIFLAFHPLYNKLKKICRR